MSTTAKKHRLHVHGMHCQSCVLLIEDNLSQVDGVRRVKATLSSKTVDIETDADATPEEIARELSRYIEKDGYSLGIEKAEHTARWHEFYYAAPIATVLIAIFVILQKIGIVNLISADSVSYPVAFLIGIVASLSSCLAVVGGLLLSISANYAKQGEQTKPQALFHVGRLISFFVFGGVIGIIGKAFTLSAGMSAGLSFAIGLIMLILGLNLLDIFPWAKKLQFRMPKALSGSAFKLKNAEHRLAPFLIGVSTFFLPCGFTQSMQAYTLTTGGFMSGALTMTAYALGTVPVLALVSFTSLAFTKGSRASGIFFKTAGILVIAFAMLSMVSGLVVVGLVPPFISL